MENYICVKRRFVYAIMIQRALKLNIIIIYINTFKGFGVCVFLVQKHVQH